MSINLDNITILPEELNYKIFSFLDPISLGNCCQVSKKYNELASHDNVWKDMFPNVSFPSGISVKKYIDSHAVISIDEIAKSIEKFVDNSVFNQIATFSVSFPYNPEYYLSICFGCVIVSGERINKILTDNTPFWENSRAAFSSMCNEAADSYNETCFVIKKLEGRNLKPYERENSLPISKSPRAAGLSDNGFYYREDKCYFPGCTKCFIDKVRNILNSRIKTFLEYARQ